MLSGIVQLFTGEDDVDRRISEMRRLDDAQLADLGISRDQIAGFVRARNGCSAGS